MEEKKFIKKIGDKIDIDIDLEAHGINIDELEPGKAHVFNIDADSPHKKVHKIMLNKGEKHSKHEDSHAVQKIIDDILYAYFLLPGVDKDKIDFRVKPDTMIVDATTKEEYQKILGKRKISLKIKLKETIKVDKINAKYEDGILMVSAPISDPSVTVNID